MPVTHWIWAAIFGPMEHLSLLISEYRATNHYLDGVQRITVGSIAVMIILFTIWVIGMALCVWAYTGKYSARCRKFTVLIISWCLVAILNIWVFAISSV